MTDRTLTQQALADLAEIPATSRWVRSAALRLHVLDYGGERPPLIVVPGITTPAIGMDFVARELTRLVRPIVLDVRGRGLSDDGPANLEAYADDVEAVVDGLGLDRPPLLLGHSMGARIGAVAAARAASAVRGTVIVEPPMSGPGRARYPTTLQAFLGQLRQARCGTSAEEVAQDWPRWPRRERQLRARWLASCSSEAITATHAGFEEEDFFAVWPSVPRPTVLIRGADSPVVTADGAAEAARTNPGAAIDTVPNAGHMVFWDEPAAAIEATRRALVRMLE